MGKRSEESGAVRREWRPWGLGAPFAPFLPPVRPGPRIDEERRWYKGGRNALFRESHVVFALARPSSKMIATATNVRVCPQMTLSRGARSVARSAPKPARSVRARSAETEKDNLRRASLPSSAACPGMRLSSGCRSCQSTAWKMTTLKLSPPRSRAACLSR